MQQERLRGALFPRGVWKPERGLPAAPGYVRFLRRSRGGGTALQRRSLQIAGGVLAALVVAGGLVLRERLGLQLDPEGLRQQVEALGPLAPVVFVAALALRFVLLIPSALLLTAGGAIFGVVLGTLYGALGLTLMGLLQYLLVQLAGADALRARVPERFAPALRAARSWRGAATLAVVSAYPVGPQTPVQLAAALAGMGLVTFLLSVGGGAMLRAGLFSWFGSALLEGERVLLAAGLLGAVVALPFLHPRSRRFVRGFFGGREDAPGEPRA
jgi:uncharacterized membrane protein YdjX (TVP38/TMEM64 family)